MKLFAKLAAVAFCASVFAALVATPVRAQHTGGDKHKMGSMMHGKMMAASHHRKHRRGRKKGRMTGMGGKKMGMMNGKKGMMGGKMGMKKGM